MIALGGKCDCTLPPIYRDVVEILGQTCSGRLAQRFEAIFPGEHLTCLGGDCWQRALRTNHVPLCRGADVGFIAPDCRSSIRSNHERSKKKSQILSSNSPPRIHPHFRLPNIDFMISMDCWACWACSACWKECFASWLCWKEAWFNVLRHARRSGEVGGLTQKVL